MWWNLDIFGKFALEIRMDYWYLWKTHFLNFRDFQESPNPFKKPLFGVRHGTAFDMAVEPP